MGAFKEVKLNEVVRVGPNLIGHIVKKEDKTPEFSLHVHRCTEDKMCKDRVRRQSSTNQEERD